MAASSYEYMGGVFNWTMTYRLDSDIVRPYGQLSPLGDTPSPAQGWLAVPAAPIAPSAAALEAHNSSDAPGEGERKALVAWLVSHCRTPSRREDYVRALSQHIDVDVYGKCGSRRWPRNDTVGFYRMLSAKYTFYLSFENSLCRDYVTEKLFNVLPLDIVPVVYGGANYSAIVPPHSYIDARDFETPRDLARYLQFLARRPEELEKFWWWKRHYRVNQYPSSVLCHLCERVHNPGPAGAYQDVARWYSGPGICQEPPSEVYKTTKPLTAKLSKT
ncbi:hypothetical protein R5R35_013315 [Gryllus longicercus]|uniref:Fucosyltransferase n=1 Tax=Gryllus longicercus TaxID=2509291 RepID=A0AAN9UZ75_9ORTH